MPTWTPKNPQTSQLASFINFVEHKHALVLTNYASLHTWSIDHPELFWSDVADFFHVRWHQLPHTILHQAPNFIDCRWFEGATLNVAEHLLTRNDQHPALICLNEQGQRTVLSYHTLRQHVERCAIGLKKLGVKPGDRVAGVLPNRHETVIAMLATTALGAIWSSCSPDFGAEALLDRLSQLEPRVVLICDGQIYQGKTHSLQPKITYLRQHLTDTTHFVVCDVIQDTLTSPDTLRWSELLSSNQPFTFTPFPFSQPMYILFSSGTTGRPKGIVHSVGGTLLQHLKELGLHADLTAKDILFFYTTCGWMMWNWMVSGLALGLTLILYDGAPAYPDHKRLFQVLEDEKVTVWGSSAAFLSSVEHVPLYPNQHVNLPHLRCILSTGSPLVAHQYDFVEQHIKHGVQLCSMSGGTDIVSCFALGNPMLNVYRGELQCLGLGMAVEIYDEQGLSVKKTRGELVCTRPFPSMPLGFWQDHDNKKYTEAYFERFPGVWAHGDWAEITAHGGLVIYGRSDAVLNPGGVRIGTAEIYRYVNILPEIVDSVAIAQQWKNDVRIVLFVKLNEGFMLDEALQTRIRQTLRQNASPRHVPAKIVQVNDIPRTLNGKIVELAVRNIVHGQPVQQQASLANPSALEEFKNRLELME